MELTPFTEKQKESLRFALKPEYKQPILIWPGSIRSGKTYGCVFGQLLRSLKFTNKHFIIAGRNVNSVERNILPYLREFAAALGIPVVPVRSKNVLRVQSNEFHLFGANTERSQDPLQGMTAAGALLDEAALMPKSFLMQVIGRCSVPGAKIFMTLNKTSPFHWVKTDIYDKRHELNALVIESTLDDNPNISEETKQLYRSTLTGHFGRRMLDNEWAAASGLVFPNYRIVDTPDPEFTRIEVGMDWGMSTITAAVLFGKKKTDGRWRAFREYYHSGELTTDQHADRLLGICPNPTIVHIDSRAPMMISALRKKGYKVRKGSHDLLTGIQVMDSAMERGDLEIHKRCKNFCAEVTSIAWDERAQEKGEDKPTRGDDHACDSGRYFAYKKWPPRGKNIPVAKPRGM